MATKALAVAAGTLKDLVHCTPECIGAAKHAGALHEARLVNRRGAMELQWQVVPLQVHIGLLAHPALELRGVGLAVGALKVSELRNGPASGS
ncbi:hypothetical protein D3C84_793990 [compost metagenome]